MPRDGSRSWGWETRRAELAIFFWPDTQFVRAGCGTRPSRAGRAEGGVRSGPLLIALHGLRRRFFLSRRVSGRTARSGHPISLQKTPIANQIPLEPACSFRAAPWRGFPSLVMPNLGPPDTRTLRTAPRASECTASGRAGANKLLAQRRWLRIPCRRTTRTSRGWERSPRNLHQSTARSRTRRAPSLSLNVCGGEDVPAVLGG